MQARICLRPRRRQTASIPHEKIMEGLKAKGRRWPRRKSVKKLRDAIRAKTKRDDGQSLEATINAINPTLRGWFEYFKHAGKATFDSLDGWVRMRLRSILRKRHGGIGRGRGTDHQRRPNAFFEGLGLYSLATAYAKECQPLKR